jgi:uncharacterized membrane protein YdjX (TVP38/TMEM64 family)
MILQAVVAPLPVFALSAANGMVFGPVWGSLIPCVGALCGATLSFFFSRPLWNSVGRRLLSDPVVRIYVKKISARYGFRVLMFFRNKRFYEFSRKRIHDYE